MSFHSKRVFGLLLFLPFLACLAGSERATKVALQGGNPPTFVLSGSGRLEQLVVFGAKQREVNSPLSYAAWYIRSENGSARRVEEIGAIEYGVLPKGYLQEYPENGAPAPELVSGQKYRYLFITSSAPMAEHDFEMRDGRAVELPEEGRLPGGN